MKHFVFVLIVVLLGGCSLEQGTVKNQTIGNALGTTYSIIYLADKEIDYQQEIDSVFAVVNQSMSTYWPDSDITKINQGDSTLVVDAMFKEVFELSRGVYEKSNGYFDPTVGTLVNAWGFGPGQQIAMDSTTVDSLLQYVGFDKVQLTNKGTISKANPAVFFDFNAVAKGYAIDRLGALLDEKGIKIWKTAQENNFFKRSGFGLFWELQEI